MCVCVCVEKKRTHEGPWEGGEGGEGGEEGKRGSRGGIRGISASLTFSLIGKPFNPIYDQIDQSIVPSRVIRVGGIVNALLVYTASHARAELLPLLLPALPHALVHIVGAVLDCKILREDEEEEEEDMVRERE